MTKPDLEILAATPDNLLASWEEAGIKIAHAEMWPPAIEVGTNTVLVARELGVRAVGAVCIMWNGPIRVHEDFRAVLEKTYPGERIAAIYGLEVSEGRRRLGHGRQLMEAAEAAILDRAVTAGDVVKRAALSVRTNNPSAIALYDSMEYAKLDLLTQVSPEFDEESGEHKLIEIESWIMAKDLTPKK